MNDDDLRHVNAGMMANQLLLIGLFNALQNLDNGSNVARKAFEFAENTAIAGSLHNLDVAKEISTEVLDILEQLRKAVL